MKKTIPLYLPLPTPEEMSRWDREAENIYGLPSLLLMENAAQAAFMELKRSGQLQAKSKILIFAGKGNNGGDGFALARILHDEGYAVVVLAISPEESLPSPAREHAIMAKKLGVNIYKTKTLPKNWDEQCLNDLVTPAITGLEPDIIVDALTGTGIKGQLRPDVLALVRHINSCRRKAFVFSLDIPSGLSGLTGKALPDAVRAHATICFEAGKPGLFMPGASVYTGRICIRRVGIPTALHKQFPPSWRLLCPEKGGWAAASPFLHKGKAGKVLIIGGSEGMSGAPLLAAMGSLRAGAGLVHVALPSQLEQSARSGFPEVLTHPIGKGKTWQVEDSSALVELIRHVSPDVVVLGPGMGRGKPVGLLVKNLLEQENRPPVLLDADSLFFLRLPEPNASAADAAPDQENEKETERQGLEFSSSSSSALLNAKDILTPHPGEMARLLPDAFFRDNRHLQDLGDIRNEEEPTAPEDEFSQHIKIIQSDRDRVVRCFTDACPSVLVFKGPGTLIARAGDATVLSPFAVSTLAVGGSGDVLSGIIAALTASGMESLDAASLGVYLHGRAGELLAKKSGRGHLAREIAEAVPAVWEELCRS